LPIFFLSRFAFNAFLMIRHRHGNAFLLINQDDHARLSGVLASHVGNARFATPSPRDQVIQGISMHDSGWPAHDQQPTLNADGLPLHVFETPVDIGTHVWMESVRLARALSDYAGLLVSLHVMALSALAQSHYLAPDKRHKSAKELFALNKFQQNQIQVQEELRPRLGLRTDLALTYGLARRGTSPGEDLLLFNYHLLKAMDGLSLALLCSELPFHSIDNVFARPGEEPFELRIESVGEWTIRMDPWPFDAPEIAAEVPYRPVAGRKYAEVEEFRREYAAAPVRMQRVRAVR